MRLRVALTRRSERSSRLGSGRCSPADFRSRCCRTGLSCWAGSRMLFPHSVSVRSPRNTGFQTLIHDDIAASVDLDTGELESNAIRVRRPPGCDQQVRRLDRLRALCVFDMTRIARPSVPQQPSGWHSATPRCPRRETVREAQRRHRRLLGSRAAGLSRSPWRANQNGEGLRQFEADIAAADDDKVRRNPFKIECLNVGHGRRLGQTRVRWGRLRECRGSGSMRSAVMTRSPPALSVMPIVFGATNRPWPIINSAPLPS